MAWGGSFCNQMAYFGQLQSSGRVTMSTFDMSNFDFACSSHRPTLTKRAVMSIVVLSMEFWFHIVPLFSFCVCLGVEHVHPFAWKGKH